MTQNLFYHAPAGKLGGTDTGDATGSDMRNAETRAGAPQAPAQAAPANSPNHRMNKVIGPDGKSISVADLPPPDTKRWVIRRKAEVVAAVRGGLISLEEACERYTLSVEEFLSWQKAIESFGLSGLRTTRLQRYRNTGREKDD